MNLSVPVFWRMNKDKYMLIGKKCLVCSHIFFPSRKNCVKCGSKNIQDHNLSGKGVVYSYTVIRTAPNGFEAPYISAIIKLKEGPMITGEITDVDIDNLSENIIDKNVNVVFRKATTNNTGLRVYCLKFLLEK